MKLQEVSERMIQLILDDDADDHDDDDDDGDEGGPQRAMRWMRKGGVCNADRKSRATARMMAWNGCNIIPVALQGSAREFG